METVLITGANRGIGLALVKLFIRERYKVIAACRDPNKTGGLSEFFQNENLVVTQLDVADGASVSRLGDALKGQPLDILVNNAGVMGGEYQGIADMDYDAWSHAFQVNTMAPLRITAALLESLKTAKKPRVVTLSSQMGSLNRKSKGSFAYRSSKAAVNKVMQVLSLELEQDGIIACPVHPGWVRTDMGGSSADISVDEAATGLFRLIEGLTAAQSGRFWTWEGLEHPW